MSSWLGHSQNELITKWGPPQEVMDDGQDGKIYTYKKDKSYTVPGSSTTTVTGSVNTYGNSTYGQANGNSTYQPSRTYEWTQIRMFWIDQNGIIYKWSIPGPRRNGKIYEATLE